MAAGMANKPCDLLDRHAIVGQQRDERVPQVPRRPVPAKPGPLANVLEHLPDVPRTQRCTGGRGEYPAGVLPMRSGSLPLSRLVHLPLPERPDGHLRQLQRAAGPRGLRVSSGPIRAQHRDRRRIAVQVDVLLPPDRPGFLGAHAGHQAHNDVGMHQRGRTPRILQPSVQLQGWPRPCGYDQRRRLGERERPPATACPPLRSVDEPGHVPADLAVGLRVPDRPAQRIMSDLQRPAGQVRRERPQTCLDLPGGEVPQRPLADLLQERGQRIPV